jgi:hypothetical protein
MLELAHDGRKLRALAHRIETALGRSLRAFFRNEAGCVRPRLERDVDHLAGRRHFEIERLVDLSLETRDIVIADMPAILAQVGGDAVAARGDRELCSTRRVGVTTAACVADRGDVIDVNAEAETFHA